MSAGRALEAHQRGCLPQPAFTQHWVCPPSLPPPAAVLDDAGASATAQLRLLLVQRFRMQAAVSLFAPPDAFATPEAAAEAAAAAAAAVAQDAALQQQLAAAFNASLAPALTWHRLDVTAAATDGASAAAATAGTAGLAGSPAAVAAAGAAQLISQQWQRRRRMAQARGPLPAAGQPAPALQLAFSLDALSPDPLLYAGASAPELPPAAAGQLSLQPIDAVFASSLQQSAAAICAALAGVLASSPVTAALGSAGGSFRCSPPAAAAAVEAFTPPVSFQALSWLPGGR